MAPPTDTAFGLDAWTSTLEKYGAVVDLSVTLYDADAHIICGPLHATPIVTLLGAYEMKASFADCAAACLAQSIHHRPPVVLVSSSGTGGRRRIAVARRTPCGRRGGWLCADQL
jgi:hypothetical protein